MAKPQENKATKDVEFFTLGSVLIDDIVTSTGDSKQGVLGGSGVHAAFGARCWSENVGLPGRAGADFSVALRTPLTSSGIVLTGFTAIKGGKTPRVWLLYEDADATRVVFRTSIEDYKARFRCAATELPALSQVPVYKAPKGVHLFCGLDRLEQYVTALRTAYPTIRIIWEPHGELAADSVELFKKVAPSVDFFSPSTHPDNLRILGNAPADAKEICSRFRALGCKTILLRMGSNGSTVQSEDNKLINVPIYKPVTVVDVTGAGNAFCGGFLAHYLQSPDLVSSAVAGTVSAALTIQQFGPIPITPETLAQARKMHAALLAHCTRGGAWPSPDSIAACPPKPATTPSSSSAPSSSDSSSGSSAVPAKQGTPPRSMNAMPIGFGVVYGDGQPDADATVSSVVASKPLESKSGAASPPPPITPLTCPRPSLSISFLLHPTASTFDIARFQGPLKLALGFAESLVKYITSRGTAIVEGQRVQTLIITVYAAPNAQEMIQRYQTLLLRLIPFDLSRIYETVVPTPASQAGFHALGGMSDAELAQFLESGGSFEQLEGKVVNQLHGLSSPKSGNRGGRGNAQSKAAFRGAFDIKCEMTLQDALRELAAFGVFRFSPLLSAISGASASPDASVYSRLPPVVQTTVDSLRKISMGLDSITVMSEARHLTLRFSGASIDVFHDFCSKPLPTSRTSSTTEGNTHSDKPGKESKDRKTDPPSSPSSSTATVFVPGSAGGGAASLVSQLVDLASRYPGLISAAEFIGVTSALPLAAAWESLVIFQRSLLYHPNEPFPKDVISQTPHHFGLNYEDCMIPCSDGLELHSWLIKQPHSGECPTIICFHGNASNISTRVGDASNLHKITGCNILMLEYRGYGLNSGKPSQAGFELDGRSAIAFLRGRSDLLRGPNSIILFGRSIGAAVAILTASHHFKTEGKDETLAAVIIENTLTSVADIVSPMLAPVIQSQIKDKWDTFSQMPVLTCPLLFLSGRKDTMIPPSMMNALHDAASKSRFKRFVPFSSGTHNDTSLCPGYYDSIKTFLIDCSKALHQNSS